MPLAPVERAQAATKFIATSEVSELAEAIDSLDSRIGQAMHRLLERFVPQSGVVSAPPNWDAALCERVAQEFALESAQLAQAQAMAQAILQGEGAWAWDAQQLKWQGNEVALVHQGRQLRIDRLVQRRGAQGSEGQWWVLDYKSAAQPQLQAELRAQLHTYRTAVAKAQPGQTVRAAFLTALGTLIELPAA